MPAIKDKETPVDQESVASTPEQRIAAEQRLAAQARALIESKFDEQNKFQLFAAIVNGMFAGGLNAQLTSANVDSMAKHAAGLTDRFLAAYRNSK